MKKKIRMWICAVLAASMPIATFTGCAKDSKQIESTKDSKNNFEYSDDSETPTSTTLTGTVKSVSGNKVTITVGGGMGSKPDGEPPAKPSGDASESKEAVLTVADESVIVVVDDNNNETQGSLSDITEGTSISISFDEDGKITSIKVGNAASKGPGGQDNGG